MIAPAIALTSVAWLALLVVTPFAPASLATLIYAVGSVLCHQIPERSFHLAGVQCPVCARCLGIYVGAAASASIHVLIGFATDGSRWPVLSPRRARQVFLAAACPTLLTVGLEWSGIWRGTNIVRAIAGIALGAGGALVVMSALATLHYSACQRRRPIEPSQIPPHI